MIHVFCKRDPGPDHANVQLWSLGRNQRPLETRTMVLGKLGDEQTAFRWTVNAAGKTTSIDELPVSLRQASGVGC